MTPSTLMGSALPLTSSKEAADGAGHGHAVSGQVERVGQVPEHVAAGVLGVHPVAHALDAALGFGRLDQLAARGLLQAQVFGPGQGDARQEEFRGLLAGAAVDVGDGAHAVGQGDLVGGADRGRDEGGLGRGWGHAMVHGGHDDGLQEPGLGRVGVGSSRDGRVDQGAHVGFGLKRSKGRFVSQHGGQVGGKAAQGEDRLLHRRLGREGHQLLVAEQVLLEGLGHVLGGIAMDLGQGLLGRGQGQLA